MRFNTVLIANRGEIALRIIRSARKMGLRTVAIYSDADVDASHVHAADLAVHIGPADSAQSYRNIPAILQACARTGAQAVHPGYGFLSENPEFAQAVVDAGLTFIGPSPEVIALMGNKAQAKVAMQAAGVPVVPGATDCTSEADLLAVADRIGYPLIFKAAAGGGGRGMRIVRDAESLLSQFRQAESEALGAFGSNEIIIEKAVEHARHIEIQVLCDEHGHQLHLGERDCSMQRRFQKIIEEAPSPAVTPDLRRAMGEVATQACAAINYVGVGTLEFLLDANGSFYFMEMNTRLQVEHGVTELVTGLDLVEQQLLVALGHPLTFGQEAVTMKGHAIELRICAEDPEAGFVPQAGSIEKWVAPSQIRVDSALRSRGVVSQYYDSMIAKYLAWAPDRDACIQKLIMACEQTVLLGIKSNVAFLDRCLRHPVFQQGAVTTGFLSQEDFTSPDWQRVRSAHATIAAAFAMSGQAGYSPASEPVSLAQAFSVALTDVSAVGAASEESVSVHIRPKNGGYTVAVGETEEPLDISNISIEAGRMSFAVDGLYCSLATVSTETGRVWVQDGASTWSFERTVIDSANSGDQAGVYQVRAPMTGKVISIPVQPGQEIRAQDVLVVVESMKMEMPIHALSGGVVGAISANDGAQISAGQVIMEITRS